MEITITIASLLKKNLVQFGDQSGIKFEDTRDCLLEISRAYRVKTQVAFFGLCEELFVLQGLLKGLLQELRSLFWCSGRENEGAGEHTGTMDPHFDQLARLCCFSEANSKG